MTCQKCGKEVEGDVNYCPYCGKFIEKETIIDDANSASNSDEVPVYKELKRYPRGTIRDSYENLQHFKLNVGTIICIIIEWVLSYFLIVLVNAIPLLGKLVRYFPFQFSSEGYNKFFGPLTLLLLAFVEFCRQALIIENDVEVAKRRDQYGADNYTDVEDVISKTTMKSGSRSLLPDFKNIEIVNLEGSEAQYLDEDEAPCWYKKDVSLYQIHEWEEEPYYVTTGDANFAVTSDWSNHEIHQDWEKFAVGELWVTNKHVVFYAFEKDKQRRNLICIGFNNIYYLQGHFDLFDTFNCIRLRINGSQPRDFIFHAADSNGEPDYQENWNGSFVNAVKFGLEINNVSDQFMGNPEINKF